MNTYQASVLNVDTPSITITEEKPHYKGSFFPRVHRLFTEQHGHLLQEGECFHLSSDFLLRILKAAGHPKIGDEDLRQILFAHLS